MHYVIFVSCVHSRFLVVVFVLYILSYYCLYVLSPCYGIRCNFRMFGSSFSQLFVLFVFVLGLTALSTIFQLYRSVSFIG